MTSAGAGNGRRPWMRPVDFATPRALAPDVETRLRRLAEDFCSSASARAKAEFALPVEITPMWLHEGSWREIHALPGEGAVSLVLETGQGGLQFIALDPAFAALIVERMLGSDPDPAQPMRAITTTDRALLRRVTELLGDVTNDLWTEAAELPVAIESVRTHNDLVTLIESSDRVLAAALEVRVGSFYTMLHLMLPLETIRPVSRKLARPSTRASGEDLDTARAVHENISLAKLDVRAEIPAIRLTARELSALDLGDRIPLNAKAGDPAALLADGVPVQYGHIGKSGNRRAVQVGNAPVPPPAPSTIPDA